MGTDIHPIAEVKEGDEWKALGAIFNNPYYQKEKEIGGWNVPLTSDPITGRNYDLFAILANVRNGRGFAGVETGAGFNIIEEPKGFPNDASEEALKRYGYRVLDKKALKQRAGESDEDEDEEDGYSCSETQAKEWMTSGYSEQIKEGWISGPDWHSASWFTLRELKEYNWDQVTENYGVVPFEEFKELYPQGKSPESYCGAVHGKDIVTVSQEHAINMLNENILPEEGKQYNVQMKWATTYRDAVGSRIFEMMTKFEEVIKEKGLTEDDIRIVFWFDN